MSAEVPDEIPIIARRYFNALFKHVDTDLIESMPTKLVVHMIHHILVASMPSLVGATYLVATEATDDQLDIFAKGVAAAFNTTAARGWRDVHKTGVINYPLPEEFQGYLELPKEPAPWK